MSSSSWSSFASHIRSLARSPKPTEGTSGSSSVVADVATSMFAKHQKVRMLLGKRPREGCVGYFDSDGKMTMRHLSGDVGSITIELYSAKCPLASFNFMSLCSGKFVVPEQEARDTIHRAVGDGVFQNSLKPQLHYKGSIFHRVIHGFGVQGGDILTNNGLSQTSVFGGTFQAREEMNDLPKDTEGLVLTASSSPDDIGSQFFVATRKLDHPKYSYLNNSCVCFGKISSGLEILKALEDEAVDFEQRPKYFDIFIKECELVGA